MQLVLFKQVVVVLSVSALHSESLLLRSERFGARCGSDSVVSLY
jgi:hypothetical protein